MLPDRRVSFPAWVRPALEHALEAPVLTAVGLADAVADLEQDDAVVLLRRLVRENVLVPR